MSVTIRATDVTSSAYCKAGEHLVETTQAVIEALNRAGRVTLRSLTGLWRDSGVTYIPGEFIIPECGACFEARTSGYALATETKLVQRHAREMMSRGVAEDDAYRVAVNARVTRDELRVHPEFVAHYTGLEHLLDGKPHVALAECCSAGCDQPPSRKCDECNRDLCERHVVIYSAPYTSLIKHLCRRCTPTDA